MPYFAYKDDNGRWRCGRMCAHEPKCSPGGRSTAAATPGRSPGSQTPTRSHPSWSCRPPDRLRMPYFILLFAGNLREFHHRTQFKHVGRKIRARGGGALRPEPIRGGPPQRLSLSLNRLGASVSLLNAPPKKKKRIRCKKKSPPLPLKVIRIWLHRTFDQVHSSSTRDRTAHAGAPTAASAEPAATTVWLGFATGGRCSPFTRHVRRQGQDPGYARQGRPMLVGPGQLGQAVPLRHLVLPDYGAR